MANTPSLDACEPASEQRKSRLADLRNAIAAGGPYKKLRFDNPSAIPKRNGVSRAH